MATGGRIRSLPRRLLLGLLLLLPMLVIGCAVWVVWFLDLDDHKPLVQQLVQRHLGIELALNGQLGHQLGLARLRLSAHDLSATHDGRPIAQVDQVELDLALAPLLRGELVIERIQGRAETLDLEWDAAGVFNLMPRLTADTEPGPEPAAAAKPSWLKTLRIDRIQAEIGDGRYQDHRLGLDLRLQRASIDIGPLPIIEDGRLVADTPALFGGYRNRWAVEAEQLRLWGLDGRGVEVVVDNDHGGLTLSRLRAETLALAGFDGGGEIRITRAELGGRLVLDYGVPAERLQHTPWQAVRRLDLDDLTLRAQRLRSGRGDAELRLDGLRANTARLSLLPGLQALDSQASSRARGNDVNPLSILLPNELVARGKALMMGNARLADYDLSIVIAKTIGIKLAKGALHITADTVGGEPLLSTQLRGEAQLALHWSPSTSNRALDLTQLQLQATDTVIGAPGDRYRVAILTVNAAAVPILRNGALLDLTQSGTLNGALGKLRLSVTADTITHQREVDGIDTLSVTVEGRGRSLVLTSAKLRIDDTVMSGTGEVALSTDRPNRHPAWRLRLDSTGVSVRELALLTDLPLSPVGQLAVDLDLSGQGFEPEQLTHTLAGTLVMVSDGMALLDLDLDKLLTHLQYTQHGNLFDISLFLLTGPAGSLIMAASDFNNIVETAEARGSSRILASRSEVHFEQGVLRVDEAALSTRNHRLAIQGSLSVYDDGPVDLTIATVDRDGCTLFRERITGTLAEPDISNGGVLAKVLLQPLRTLAGKLLPGKRCIKPFYTGVIAPPGASDQAPPGASDRVAPGAVNQRPSGASY